MLTVHIILHALVVTAKACHQLAAAKEGDDPLTASHFPLLSTDVPDDSDTPQSVENGKHGST